jgi:hypothetical protein
MALPVSALVPLGIGAAALAGAVLYAHRSRRAAREAVSDRDRMAAELSRRLGEL